jgi:hypothetical protein
MLPNTAPSTPMAITALPPIVANPSFHVVAVTLTTPFGSGSSATMRRGVALMVQVRRGYPARPCKTPEKSDWQPIYRFSRQRYTGSPGTRERRARIEGGAGNRGVLPTDPRRPRGAFWRTAVVLTRSRWRWRNPHRPEPDALAGFRAARTSPGRSLKTQRHADQPRALRLQLQRRSPGSPQTLNRRLQSKVHGGVLRAAGREGG